MSRHSFDPDIASDVGINAAVIYQNIYWWCDRNKVKGKNCVDGKFWTYNSVREFTVLFPYLTEKQIRTALDKLVETGYLLTGQFNKLAYDRTKWYCPSAELHSPCVADVTDPYGEPIPVIKPVIKPVEGQSLFPEEKLEVENPSQTKVKRATEFKEDWEPNSKTLAWAEKKGFRPAQIAEMAEACKLHHIAKGTKFKNHEAAFQTWVNNQIKFNRVDHGKSSAGPQPTKRRSLSAHFANMHGDQR